MHSAPEIWVISKTKLLLLFCKYNVLFLHHGIMIYAYIMVYADIFVYTYIMVYTLWCLKKWCLLAL
jgi:hypothetical protein